VFSFLLITLSTCILCSIHGINQPYFMPATFYDSRHGIHFYVLDSGVQGNYSGLSFAAESVRRRSHLARPEYLRQNVGFSPLNRQFSATHRSAAFKCTGPCQPHSLQVVLPVLISWREPNHTQPQR
jgi:hypothetical protein